MNIYFENAGFRKNYKTVSRCCRQFGGSDPLYFHIICEKGLSPLHLYLLTRGNQGIATVTLRIHARKLTDPLVRLCNSSGLLDTVILVDKALTHKQWKRICRLNGILRIVDTSDAPNEAFYESNRNVIWRKGNTDTLLLADIYHLTVSDRAIYQCHFSSCLGKTLFIAKDGAVSFCPHHPAESRLGTLEQLDGIFDAPVFYDTLMASVAKRNHCKNSCPHFEKCKGGCPLESDCDTFLRLYPDALRDRDEIIARQTDLTALPLFKELAVLRHLCDVGPKQ